MSIGLSVLAFVLIFAVGTAAGCVAWDRVEDWQERRRNARERAQGDEVAALTAPIRPAAPATDRWWPIRVGQTEIAEAADAFRLTREERDRFDLAVAVYRNVSAGRLVDVRPEVEQ